VTAVVPETIDTEDTSTFSTVAANSASVALWTAVSRVTGFARVVTIAAVLGPTYFGNLFQSVNLLPNAAFELLAGSLLASLLVPAIVHAIDARDPETAGRIAGGFLGVLCVLFGVVVLLFWLASPLIARLLVVGVDDAGAIALQERSGWLLLALVAPQVVCYGIVGTGAAAQNACGRFALAAGAPLVENVGVIFTLLLSAVWFGTGRDLSEVSTAQVLLLGVGATASVLAHAAVQWWGAYRAGVTLRPRAGWRDPDVRAMSRVARPSAGMAALMGLRYLAILVVAGSVPGGVVAFTMAVNLFNLPVALGARPVAAALLPRLSRLALQGRERLFRDEWAQGLGLAFFVCAPAAVAYLALCRPLAGAAAFGEMATNEGVQLITVSVASVGLGLLGEAAFIMGMAASFARRDAASPLRAMALRMAVSIPGMAAALLFADGLAVLAVLGISLTVGDLVAGGVLSRQLVRALPAGLSTVRPLLRSLGAALIMVVPAGLLAWNASLHHLTGPTLTAQVAVAVVLGAIAFIATQLWWRAPEPRQLFGGLAQRGGSA
jgi:putative peptidoglycan lipid II flippase